MKIRRINEFQNTAMRIKKEGIFFYKKSINFIKQTNLLGFSINWKKTQLLSKKLKLQNFCIILLIIILIIFIYFLSKTIKTYKEHMFTKPEQKKSLIQIFNKKQAEKNNLKYELDKVIENKDELENSIKEIKYDKKTKQISELLSTVKQENLSLINEIQLLERQPNIISLRETIEYNGEIIEYNNDIIQKKMTENKPKT